MGAGRPARAGEREAPSTMSEDQTRCPHCHAKITAPRPEACGYCGVALPAAHEPAPVAPQDVRAGRLAGVRENAEFSELMGRTPSTAGMAFGLVFMIGFMVLFAGVALFMAAGILGMGGGVLAVVPAGMAVLAVLVLGVFAVKAARTIRAPLQRVPAEVLDERVELTGEGQNHHTRSRNYVLLEFENGVRRECRTSGRIAGRVAPGDVGVAYFKRDYLFDFQLVRA